MSTMQWVQARDSALHAAWEAFLSDVPMTWVQA